MAPWLSRFVARSPTADRRLPTADWIADCGYGLTIEQPPQPIPSPTTAPVGILEANNRLQQVLRVVDESDPHRRTKPDGVEGAEVWMKIGPAPAGPSEMQLAGMLTNHRFAQAFADGDAGKTAHYKMRWYNRRGERGPWSETLSATIAA